MKKIFISYKRKNKDEVLPIVKEIQNRVGIDCWIDLNGIESGDQFEHVIIKAINESEIVLFMMSKEAIAPYSPKDGEADNVNKLTWTEMEVKYALSHGKRLVPISIDGTKPADCDWLSFRMGGSDYVNYSKEESREKFFKNLKDWVDSSLISDTQATTSTPTISNCILKIKIPLDCQILLDGENMGQAQANSIFKLHLNPDEEYELVLIDTINSSNRYEETICLSNGEPSKIFKPNFGYLKKQNNTNLVNEEKVDHCRKTDNVYVTKEELIHIFELCSTDKFFNTKQKISDSKINKNKFIHIINEKYKYPYTKEDFDKGDWNSIESYTDYLYGHIIEKQKAEDGLITTEEVVLDLLLNCCPHGTSPYDRFINTNLDSKKLCLLIRNQIFPFYKDYSYSLFSSEKMITRVSQVNISPLV